MNDIMQEIIQYFESIEARIAALETKEREQEEHIAQQKAQIEALIKRLEEVESRPTEVIREEVPAPQPVVVPEPIPTPAPAPEPMPESTPEPTPDPAPTPAPQPQPQTAINDIRRGISLGDRFLFQRELFAGNGEKMQKTLDELNALSSLDEAVRYVSRFEWNAESPTYELFMNVLKRRFN